MTAVPRPSSPWKGVAGQPWALALALLVASSLIVLLLQPAYFEGRTFANNLRSYLPLIFLAVAQTVVVIGGGIDLSLGAVLTLASVVMVRVFGDTPGALEVALGLLAGIVTATLAGALNGLAVAYLRLQPIIATFAMASLWGGAALWVLPQPGGVVPQGLQDFVRFNPLVPFALVVIALLILGWYAFLGTRAARALFAVGGAPQAAYSSGVSVERVQVLSYAGAGALTGIGAVFLIAETATGDPLIGAPLTLSSIVAVVIGGTRLSGGQGSVIGSILGVIVLALLRQVIAFQIGFRSGLSPQWQTLIDGIIVVLALAGPGVVRWLRGLGRA
jgi:ribose transport system permease protein